MAFSILLWIVVAIYASSSLFWLYEVGWLRRRYDPPPLDWGSDDVQVRILTIGREQVVQSTVDGLDPSLRDVHVIAEEELDVDGAAVHVVPESFTSAATRKGRAVEWARRHVPCDREYVLYLDEDTLLPAFEGLPDSDVVQLREKPVRTGSWLTYLAEIFRMGFQIEQRSFPLLDLPLYAWGGGLAIRREVEAQVTWDEDTIVEDTTFAWRAVLEQDATFAVIDTFCFNQAPPTITAMCRQRRRWIAGSREENDILPLDYFLLYGLRNLSWGISPVIPFLLLVPLVSPWRIVFADAFTAAAIALLGVLYSWAVVGIRYYEPGVLVSAAVLLLVPVLTVVHAAGATWGLIDPPESFEVTEKVDPREIASLGHGQRRTFDVSVPETEGSIRVFVDEKGRVRTVLAVEVDDRRWTVSLLYRVDGELVTGLLAVLDDHVGG